MGDGVAMLKLFDAKFGWSKVFMDREWLPRGRFFGIGKASSLHSDYLIIFWARIVKGGCLL